MSNRIAELVSALTPDPWRRSHEFSADLEQASQELSKNAGSTADTSRVLGAWLRTYQPCLFGRIAATFDRITYCILHPSDLAASDEHMHSQIQASRQEWTRQAFAGKKSGFVILAVSPVLASATPDSTMLALAAQLCALYLEEEEVRPDEIYLDQIYLESPDQTKATWVWDAGVNYFAANGDQRWWNDHRIPGGVGLSINSVGHMVKAGLLAEAFEKSDTAPNYKGEKKRSSRPNSLHQALELAMRTIDMASETISGRATNLINSTRDGAPCPRELPPSLATKNCHEYLGYYHTDYTLPSDYFRSDVERPPHVRARHLDFTYLFANEVANPDYRRMGEGRKIRAAVGKRPYSGRVLKAAARLELKSDHPRLVESLKS
jgi:hypothetical protein